MQKGKWKGKSGSFNGTTTVESQVSRPSSVMKKVEKQKGKKAKVGMTVKVGESERDGQKVKVGTRQPKVGSNKGQQE